MVTAPNDVIASSPNNAQPVMRYSLHAEPLAMSLP